MFHVNTKLIASSRVDVEAEVLSILLDPESSERHSSVFINVNVSLSSVGGVEVLVLSMEHELIQCAPPVPYCELTYHDRRAA